MATLREILPDTAQQSLFKHLRIAEADRLLDKQLEDLTLGEFQTAASSLRNANFAYPSDAKLLIDLISDSGNW